MKNILIEDVYGHIAIFISKYNDLIRSRIRANNNNLYLKYFLDSRNFS